MSVRASMVLGFLWLGSACVMFLIDPATAQDGQYRWRISRDDRNSFLFAAEFDATDSYGPVSFSCERGFGRIEVDVAIGKTERDAISLLIKSHAYPKVEIVGELETAVVLLEKLTYSGMNGWSYSFTIPAEFSSLVEFERTGSFQFAIGGTKGGTDLEVGREVIKAFRETCRKTNSH